MTDRWSNEPTPYDDLPEINSYDEIPAFANEDEEHEFWSTIVDIIRPDRESH